MKKTIAIVGMIAALAACEPTVPDSGAGVGFNDYANFELERARREAALNGSGSTAFPTASAQTSGAPTPSQPTTQAIPSTDLQAAGIGAGTAPGAPLTAINPSAAGTQATAPVNPNNPGISDENDFSAVSSRETIQSDAERRQQQAAAREVIQPTAIPTRPTETGANIVAYALSAPNRLGQEWYSRSILSGQSRFQRNCAAYNNPDAAQRDFLARGGPDRDPRGIDPDGDGFACGWDPAPFLLAAGR